jgi:ribulose-5-phosphate 4-epimerase/fuculose-1-phosphate aldolase
VKPLEEPKVFGNVSAIDRSESFGVTKPGGVPYLMKPEDMVMTDLDGKIIEAQARKSISCIATPTPIIFMGRYR